MALTVGMIGLRHPHSAGHLRTLNNVPEIARVVAHDADPAAHAVARQHCAKATETTDDLTALLARPEISTVLVALPTDQTPAVVVQAARAGKHILCEKPVGRTADDLAPVLQALGEHRRALGVFYTWRRHPVMLHLRDLVRGGALGALTSVELRMVTTQVGLRDPSHWLFKREVSGGGITSWLGCHWLDALRFVTGEEVAAVTALTATLSGEAIDVEDVSAVAFRLSGGALGTLHAGYLIAQGRAGYEGAAYDQEFTLRGSLGRATFSRPAHGDPTVVLHSAAPGWNSSTRQVATFTLADAPAYGGVHGLEFVREFLRAAEQGAAGPATALDALRVVEILDAVYESSRLGQVTAVAHRPG